MSRFPLLTALFVTLLPATGLAWQDDWSPRYVPLQQQQQPPSQPQPVAPPAPPEKPPEKPVREFNEEGAAPAQPQTPAAVAQAPAQAMTQREK